MPKSIKLIGKPYTCKLIVYRSGCVEVYRQEDGADRLTLRRKSADSAIKFIREHSSGLTLDGIYLVQSDLGDEAEREVNRYLLSTWQDNTLAKNAPRVFGGFTQ